MQDPVKTIGFLCRAERPIGGARMLRDTVAGLEDSSGQGACQADMAG
ncbi:MAG: hypothetical protein U0231_00695 [Nitrospiraceae bacterium]